jgi:hypothetical protein
LNAPRALQIYNAPTPLPYIYGQGAGACYITEKHRTEKTKREWGGTKKKKTLGEKRAARGTELFLLPYAPNPDFWANE